MLGLLPYITVELRMSNLQRMILYSHLVVRKHPEATTWHMNFSPVKCAEAAQVQREVLHQSLKSTCSDLCRPTRMIFSWSWKNIFIIHMSTCLCLMLSSQIFLNVLLCNALAHNMVWTYSRICHGLPHDDIHSETRCVTLRSN